MFVKNYWNDLEKVYKTLGMNDGKLSEQLFYREM